MSHLSISPIIRSFTRGASDDTLPRILWEFGCHRPLHQLHIQGQPEAFKLLERLPHDGFAVVGTRYPQPRSVLLAQKTIADLKDSRRIILSGLAKGIDTAAHEAALKAGLPTIAVLGSPLDDIYPRQNRELAQRIVRAGGLIVTEYPNKTRIERHFFLMRNRIIAGWSKATWVVQAGYRSGALSTAQWAFEMNRDCYVTPAFPDEFAFEGCLDYIHRNKADPLWLPENLKDTWPDLEYLQQKSRRRRKTLMPPELQRDLFSSKAALLPDARLLQLSVARVTAHRGGAQIDEMLDWSQEQKWEPQRFFNALQQALSEKLVADQNGVLTAILLDQT